VALRNLNTIAKAVQSLQGDNIMPIVITPKKKKKDNMGEEKISPKKNMGMDSMMPKKKKKVQYKAYGGKIGDGNYKSCGANIVRTK